MPRYMLVFRFKHHGNDLQVELHKTAKTVTEAVEWLETTFQPTLIVGIKELSE